ncbi:nitrate- and nitrite sensing domain-containing protein [Vibrio hannami]|uniref:nitrate- and nitrite sensing domain-containing protein n=1 Tax=Vibrio hannami TaxID=2717094 RepID=UPI0024100660|nr:nitrate- and nitrite sensing domain-containing protein [Vibrio hannami]MDG3087504.1 nitrate- and nitrite sensing domain-containing protein [Vibrio hannami]
MDYIQLAIFGTCIIIAICLLLVVVHVRTNRLYKSQLSEGLTQLQKLKKLLTLLQQHRGLVNGYLCGDKSLYSQIQVLQKEISSVSNTLFANEKWSKGVAEWKSIEKDFKSLSVNYEKLEPSQSFQKHCAVITHLLDLIDDCGEHYSLYDLKDTENRSVRYLWRELLVTIEYIGQARAIGTGVAASGECNSVDRIKLNYLQQVIGAIRQEDRSRCPVSPLIDLIQNEIVVEKPKLSAATYFKEATHAMENALKIFDDALVNIDKQYS